MPPKPQVFKTPDGKEFATRPEWREYMLTNFYSFKNKVDEPEPLIKLPGIVDGQAFEIADCKNSTLIVLDHTEQVQIDQVENCRIFIGAGASSIFIRNCTNCVFYTCCRQLRLRDVINCTFYIYSMSEVHIEFSSQLKFAPFNGGYPDHAKHLSTANLDLKQNLWYDIYDHNDPGKTKVNWSLLPETEYESPWFPLGPCEPAIPRTKPGSVESKSQGPDTMQSFSLQQMMQDAQKIKISPPAAPVASVTPQTASVATPIPLPTPSVDLSNIEGVVNAYVELVAGQSLKEFVTPTFFQVLPSGIFASASDIDVSAPVVPKSIIFIKSQTISKSEDLAVVVAFVNDPSAGKQSVYTFTLLASEPKKWLISQVQQS